MELALRAPGHDLELSITEAGPELEVTLQYASDLFQWAGMGRLARVLARAAGGYSWAHAGACWTTVDSARGRAAPRDLGCFNATQAEGILRGSCIHELFEEQVERTPDAVALVYRESVPELRRAQSPEPTQLARYLGESRGVGADQLVGICVERSLEMVVGLLGILKAGGAYVPLEPSYPAERLHYMLNDAAPRECC